MKTKTLIFVFAVALLVVPSAFAGGIGHYAGENVIRVHGGSFEPEGESRYWQDKEVDFFGTAEDFDDFRLSVDWVHYVSARVGVIGSFSGYEGELPQNYRDFVIAGGGEIFHDTTLDIGTFELGIIVHLLSGDAIVLPYLGAGIGIHSWELTEDGDFLDFGFDPPALFNDVFFDDGDAFGTFFLAGVEVPLGSSWSVFAEGRWVDADDELSGDFAGLGTLDLSGKSIGGGVSVSF